MEISIVLRGHLNTDAQARLDLGTFFSRALTVRSQLHRSIIISYYFSSYFIEGNTFIVSVTLTDIMLIEIRKVI